MSIQAKMDGGNKSVVYNLGHLNIVPRQQDCHLHLDQRGLKLPGNIFGTCPAVTTKFVNQRKRKHENDTKGKSSMYKHARTEKCYLTLSTADRDYGTQAVTTNTTDQQELHKLCKEY